jgi:hypothetical protein
VLLRPSHMLVGTEWGANWISSLKVLSMSNCLRILRALIRPVPAQGCVGLLA